jgi:queuosine biosynthesis protein QueC
MNVRAHMETGPIFLGHRHDSMMRAIVIFRVGALGFHLRNCSTAGIELRKALIRARSPWDIPTLNLISDTALTRDVAIEMGAGGLPNTFVPGRNLVFRTFAAALAYRRGISHTIGGMGETDHSGYPDCHDDTIRALQHALNLGMDRTFELHTPLMWRDKAAIWTLANELGG